MLAQYHLGKMAIFGISQNLARGTTRKTGLTCAYIEVWMVGGIWLTAAINVASSVRNIEVMLKTITVIVVTVAYGFSKILMMLTIRSLWLLLGLVRCF